jgi:hypothetical protein
MRRVSLALAALTAITGLSAGGAHAAAVKPSCKIITDSPGDAKYNGAAAGSDSDDIVSADLASNAKTLVAVIRTKTLTYPDPQWAPGRVYSISFALKGMDADEIFVAARTDPQGVQYILGHRAPDATLPITTSYVDAAVTGNVDPAKGEVRINVPLSALAKLGKAGKGTVIKGASAKIERIVGQGAVPSQEVGGKRVPIGGLLLQFDISDGATKPYTLGASSCVKV